MSLSTAQEVWNMTLKLLEETLHPVMMSAWFDKISAVSFQGNQMVLRAPEEFTKSIVESRFLPKIREALFTLFGEEIEVSLIVGEEPSTLNTPRDASEEYTFQQFIVGPSNKFAHAAAIAVANHPAETYNPLFIYGQSGLGKTHLLYAISSVVAQNLPGSRIVYIKGEDFTNELVSAIQEGSVQQFRAKYRMADLLLVDDIQFLAGKERTQEEFFHTFNSLYESRKQIVLTSDRPPKEIHTLEDRLKTRFEWGLLADIQPPDYETRLAIIRAKAQLLNFDIPSDVAAHIARAITDNVRQLEGTVKKMMALHELMGVPMGIPLAEQAIKDVISEGKPITTQLILQEVAKFYGISADKLSSSNRSKETVLPRQVAMYLVRQELRYSLPEIGKIFSKDHTTVLHSINKIENYLATSDEMGQVIDTLKKNLTANQ